MLGLKFGTVFHLQNDRYHFFETDIDIFKIDIGLKNISMFS